MTGTSSGRSTPRPATSTATVLLSYLAFILVGVSGGVGSVLLPAQMADYHVDMATIGLTFFTFSAGYFLAGSVTGPLMARFGTRAALLVGGALFALVTAYLGLRPPFVVFVLVQLLTGFGMGILESVLNVYLAALPAATTLLNRLHAFFGVGALLGPLLAAWMLQTQEWTAVYLVVAALTVPVILAFLVIFPAHTPAEAEPHGGPRGLLGTVARQPAVLLAAVFLTVYVGLEISVGNWGYTYLLGEHQQAALVASWSISAYWLGLTIGRFVISPVAIRLGVGAARMVLGCLVGIVVALLVIWWAPVPVLASVGLAVLGFFLAPLFPTLLAVVPRLTSPRLVPTAIGLINGLSVIGGSALPWLAGAVAGGVGLWTLMPYALALAAVQIVVWRAVTSRMVPEPGAVPAR